MTEYSAAGGPGMIAFAAKVPGSIHEIEIAPGHSYMIHKHGFLCATEGAQLSIGFQRGLGAGLFGGNGFILQKLSGPCTAFVELGGECVVYDLPPGQSLMVHPGHIGMFQDTVGFDITFIARHPQRALRRRRVVHRPPDRAGQDLAAKRDGAGAGACYRAISGRPGSCLRRHRLNRGGGGCELPEGYIPELERVRGKAKAHFTARRE